MAISASVTRATKEAIPQRFSCICYPVQFQQKIIQVFLDSENEVNTMTPAYTAKLDVTIQKINIGANKMDS